MGTPKPTSRQDENTNSRLKNGLIEQLTVEYKNELKKSTKELYNKFKLENQQLKEEIERLQMQKEDLRMTQQSPKPVSFGLNLWCPNPIAPESNRTIQSLQDTIG